MRKEKILFRSITIASDLTEYKSRKDVILKGSDSFRKSVSRIKHEIETESPHYIENGSNNAQSLNRVAFGG